MSDNIKICYRIEFPQVDRVQFNKLKAKNSTM